MTPSAFLDAVVYVVGVHAGTVRRAWRPPWANVHNCGHLAPAHARSRRNVPSSVLFRLPRARARGEQMLANRQNLPISGSRPRTQGGQPALSNPNHGSDLAPGHVGRSQAVLKSSKLGRSRSSARREQPNDASLHHLVRPSRTGTHGADALLDITTRCPSPHQRQDRR